MSNVRFTKSILQNIAATLKPRGFRKFGNSFIRDNGKVALVIQVQKSRYSTAAAIELTLNLGIFLWSLEHLHWTKVTRPAVEISHWHQRIGSFIPAHDDKWWQVATEQQAQDVGVEIADILIRVCLPVMEKLASEAALLALWESGRSPGLTDMQRMRYVEALRAQAERR